MLLGLLLWSLSYQNNLTSTLIETNVQYKIKGVKREYFHFFLDSGVDVLIPIIEACTGSVELIDVIYCSGGSSFCDPNFHQYLFPINSSIADYSVEPTQTLLQYPIKNGFCDNFYCQKENYDSFILDVGTIIEFNLIYGNWSVLTSRVEIWNDVKLKFNEDTSKLSWNNFQYCKKFNSTQPKLCVDLIEPTENVFYQWSYTVSEKANINTLCGNELHGTKSPFWVSDSSDIVYLPKKNLTYSLNLEVDVSFNGRMMKFLYSAERVVPSVSIQDKRLFFSFFVNPLLSFGYVVAMFLLFVLISIFCINKF